MILHRYVVGPLMVNSYIIGCEESRIAAIVDPGDEAERLLEQAKALDLNIKQIINTHGHADHIGNNGEVKRATGAEIYIHPLDAEMLTNPEKNLSVFFGEAVDSPPADGYLEEGRPHRIGELAFRIIHIPGHSSGSVCLAADNLAIVGDVLFAGSIGRTDFPGGSFDELVGGIRAKLFPLGDSTEILPGHGPPTTIGDERKHNPFLREGLRL
ncbi:MAG: MBL fold metallo-hydrolase [candidate division Zixibacteria bacterium]|nr:MBL fold metallo-hydrolase [Candidatus Tariuqbacter arcticus]